MVLGCSLSEVWSIRNLSVVPESDKFLSECYHMLQAH